MKLILASESPRRKELLNQIGMEFEVMSCGGEAPVAVTMPWKIVEEHAMQKAEAVAFNVTEPVVIVGADTVVALEDCILEKPKSKEEAKAMLQKLQGNVHQVYTGVVIIKKYADGTLEKTKFHECTKVTFYEMSAQEIEDYVNTGEPMDKAGSYGIQGIGAKYIKEISGDYNNVVGLPVARLYQELKQEKRYDKTDCK